jgi:hypothetical protein
MPAIPHQFITPDWEFRSDWSAHYCGVADDITNGTRQAGAGLTLSSSVIELKQLDYQFTEPLEIAGARVRFADAVVGDWVHYEVVAPATPISSTPGTGNVNLADVGGFNILVPAPLGDGSHTVDLGAALNANVDFTAATPVPAPAVDGYFNYAEDAPAADQLAVVANPGAPNGNVNLFDAEITISGYAVKHQLLGGGEDWLVSTFTGKARVEPHWIHRVKLNNSTTKSLDVVWSLLVARKTSTA